MRERSVAYRNGERDLFGVLAGPGDGRGKGVGMVIVHPFAEEKLIAHRHLVTFSRTMASAGYDVLRFDMTGHGDSGGDWEEATVRTSLSDIRCSMDLLRNHAGCSRIGTVGFRFGATLAALASAAEERPDYVVLVAPVLSGKAYMDQCLRSNLTTQMTVLGRVTRDRKDLVEDLKGGGRVNIDGYLLTGELYGEIVGIDLLSSPPPEGVPVLAIGVRPSGPGTPSADAKAIAEAWGRREGIRVEDVPGPIFWKDEKVYRSRLEAVEGTVLEWLVTALGGGAP